MGEVFINVFNMSIVASVMIVAVILLRIILRNAPKWIRCFMWSLVAVRLCFPFKIESNFSLVPNAQQIDNSSVSSVSYINNITESSDKGTDILSVISIIWIVGVAIMLIYMLVSYINICIKTSEKVKLRDNIWKCDHIASPFVMGILKPKIYICSDMEQKNMEYVIAHETAHIKRCDNVWKPFSFLLLSIYWFNPLCWIAYIMFCKDIELSCDEKVIRDFDIQSKKEYSQALLSCSSKKYMINACPMVFGENNVKKRVIGVLKYKKPAVIVIALSVITILLVGGVFLTNPVSKSAKITEKVSVVNKYEKNKKIEETKPEIATTEPVIKATETVPSNPTEEVTTKATQPLEETEAMQYVEETTKPTQPVEYESETRGGWVEIQEFEKSEVYKKQFESNITAFETKEYEKVYEGENITNPIVIE